MGIVVGVDVLLKRVKTCVGGGGRGVDVVLDNFPSLSASPSFVPRPIPRPPSPLSLAPLLPSAARPLSPCMHEQVVEDRKRLREELATCDLIKVRV